MTTSKSQSPPKARDSTPSLGTPNFPADPPGLPLLVEKTSSEDTTELSKALEAASNSKLVGIDRILENGMKALSLPPFLTEYKPYYWRALDMMHCCTIESVSPDGTRLTVEPFSLSHHLVVAIIAEACRQNDWEFFEALVKRSRRYRKPGSVPPGSIPYEPRDTYLIRNWVRLHDVDPNLPGLCWFTPDGRLQVVEHLVETKGLIPRNEAKGVLKNREVIQELSKIAARIRKLGLKPARSLFKLFRSAPSGKPVIK